MPSNRAGKIVRCPECKATIRLGYPSRSEASSGKPIPMHAELVSPAADDESVTDPSATEEADVDLNIAGFPSLDLTSGDDPPEEARAELPDASTTDASTTDASTTDASTSDATTTDASTKYFATIPFPTVQNPATTDSIPDLPPKSLKDLFETHANASSAFTEKEPEKNDTQNIDERRPLPTPLPRSLDKNRKVAGPESESQPEPTADDAPETDATLAALDAAFELPTEEVETPPTSSELANQAKSRANKTDNPEPRERKKKKKIVWQSDTGRAVKPKARTAEPSEPAPVLESERSSQAETMPTAPDIAPVEISPVEEITNPTSDLVASSSKDVSKPPSDEIITPPSVEIITPPSVEGTTPVRKIPELEIVKDLKPTKAISENEIPELEIVKPESRPPAEKPRPRLPLPERPVPLTTRRQPTSPSTSPLTGNERANSEYSVSEQTTPEHALPRRATAPTSLPVPAPAVSSRVGTVHSSAELSEPASPESIRIDTNFQTPEPQRASPALIRERARQSRSDRTTLTRFVAICVLLLGAINLGPAIFHWIAWSSTVETGDLPRWIYIQIFLAALHLIYAIFLWQIPDWSALKAVSFAMLAFAFLFGIVSTGLVLGGAQGTIARALEIATVLTGPASLWCVVMLCLATLVSYMGVREASNWQRAEKLLAEILANKSHS